MIPWDSPNGEMDEEHVWVGSFIQTNGKQNGSYKERFQSISKIMLYCLWECPDK